MIYDHHVGGEDWWFAQGLWRVAGDSSLCCLARGPLLGTRLTT